MCRARDPRFEGSAASVVIAIDGTSNHHAIRRLGDPQHLMPLCRIELDLFPPSGKDGSVRGEEERTPCHMTRNGRCVAMLFFAVAG